jgi:hypothetical protein
MNLFGITHPAGVWPALSGNPEGDAGTQVIVTQNYSTPMSVMIRKAYAGSFRERRTDTVPDGVKMHSYSGNVYEMKYKLSMYN